MAAGTQAVVWAGVFNDLWKYRVAPPVKVELVVRGQRHARVFVSVAERSGPANFV